MPSLVRFDTGDPLSMPLWSRASSFLRSSAIMARLVRWRP